MPRATFLRFLSLVMAGVLLLAAARAPAETPKFDPRRDAVQDVAAALAQAKAAGKRVLVDVGGEWCVWCHYLDAFFEDDAEARELRDARYVVVKVNWSPENKNGALLSRWPKIPGYPHLFVLDADGGLVRSQPTDVLEKGRGYDRGKVIAFLRRYQPDPVGPGASHRDVPGGR